MRGSHRHSAFRTRVSGAPNGPASACSAATLRGTCRLARPNGGLEVVAVHAGDRVNADELRTRLLTLAEKRAAAEALDVHLLDHLHDTPRALGLALREKAEMTYLGRREQRGR